MSSKGGCRKRSVAGACCCCCGCTAPLKPRGCSWPGSKPHVGSSSSSAGNGGRGTAVAAAVGTFHLKDVNVALTRTVVVVVVG
eukprot:scaffold17350_cov16-Tisochrysis_lutea.AAC.1